MFVLIKKGLKKMSIDNQQGRKSRPPAGSDFSRKTTVLLLFIVVVVATGLLALVIAATNERIYQAIRIADESSVNLVPGILSAFDVIERHRQCEVHFSVMNSAQISGSVEGTADFGLTIADLAGQKRLIDMVPLEYSNGKLDKLMMVYETCRLSKLVCNGWDCTVQPNQSTNEQNR